MSWLDTIAAAGLVIASTYHALMALRLRQWSKKRPAADEDQPLQAVTFFRPMKPGVRDMRGKLAQMAAALRPGDQLLAGFDEKSMPEERLDGVEYVVCHSDRNRNPKISKLAEMSKHARNAHWIVIDSEALVDGGFLDRFRSDWKEYDVLTAGYRFSGGSTLPEWLDHAPVIMWLWPGLMAARMHFTLGACTGVRREDIAQLGGWESLGDLLAEDYHLGHRLSKLGRSVGLSRAVLTLESDPMSWRSWFRHQQRVAITYRVSEPAGWLGAVAIQTALWMLMLVLVNPASFWRWLVAGIALAIRVQTVRANARSIGFILPHPLLVPALAALAEPFFWAASWLKSSVHWGNRILRVTREGRIQYPAPPEPDRSRADGA